MIQMRKRILPGLLPTKSEGIAEIKTLFRYCGVKWAPVTSSQLGRQGADSGSAGHKGRCPDNNEMEGLARLEITVEDLRSHMTTAWNKTMVWIEDEAVFTEMNTLMAVARGATDSHQSNNMDCQGRKKRGA